MNRFALVLAVLLVAVLTLASGLVHGWMSNRWGLPEDLVALGNKLQDIPDQFGDWRLESSGDLSDTEIEMLECAGYIVRTYVNRVTGDKANVALLVGPSMPISLHRPGICWDSRGHKVLEKERRVTVRDSEGSDQEFWAMTFQKNDLNKGLVRDYYGWSDGGPWSYETERRLSLTRRPYLYKIEVVSPLPPHANPATNDPCRRFLEQFVPVAKPYMVQPSGTAPDS